MLTIRLQGDKVCNVDKRETQQVVVKGGDIVVNTQLLEEKIKETGKTKTYLAKKLDISIQTFRLKCINKYDFKMSEVSTLCTELGVTGLQEKEKIFNSKVDKMETA